MGKFNSFCNDFWHSFNDVKNAVESHTGIILGVGLAVSAVGTVLACKATLKVSQKSEEHIKLVADTKANCAEAQMDKKETRKEVMKAYGHIGVDYVRTYWPAVGVTILGWGLVIRAHVLDVAAKEMWMGAYIAVSGLFTKYRMKVAEKIGEEQEKELYDLTKIEHANEHVIGENYKGPFVNGSYLLYNSNCTDYQEGCPQANAWNIDMVENDLNNRLREGRRVYVNDMLRAFGHKTIKGGFDWCWYKPLTGLINFRLRDPLINPEFAKGYGFDESSDTIAKLMIEGCVHVSETFKAEYRNNELADGGVMGGSIGMDPVIVG